MAVDAGKNDNGVVEFQFRRRENQTKWQAIQRAIYDPDTKQFLGRTSKNWGKIFFFYLFFNLSVSFLEK